MKPRMKFFKSLKPNFKINHFSSSQKPQLDNVGPMASLLKTRSVIRFKGPDTIKFLQGLLTNDVRRFTESTRDYAPNLSTRSLYTAMLTLDTTREVFVRYVSLQPAQTRWKAWPEWVRVETWTRTGWGGAFCWYWLFCVGRASGDPKEVSCLCCVSKIEQKQIHFNQIQLVCLW